MSVTLKPDMSTTREKRWSSIGKKLIAWSIATFGFLIVAYFSWLRLPISLWHWANEAWWHWVAVFLYFPLFLAPFITFMGAPSMIAAAGAGTQSHLRWETVSYIGALGVVTLILLASTPAPEGWAWRHWLLWASVLVCAAVVTAASRMLCIVCTVSEVDKTKKIRDTYSAEWRFNHGDVALPPEFGIAMSGGGIRSAAFDLGVLHALHDKGILRDIDVMSAVSGGSYTMSWYLLQPYYAAKAAESEHKDFKLDDVLDEMFCPDGRFQAYLCKDPTMVGDRLEIIIGALMDMTINQPLRGLAAAWGDVGLYNTVGFGRTQYRNQIQNLFQGVPSPDLKHEITNKIDSDTSSELHSDRSGFFSVAPVKYRELAEFLQQNRLPFFIFNAAVLVQRAYRHMLWPSAFEFTAHDVGSDVCGYRAWDGLRRWEVSEHRSKGMSNAEWFRRIQPHRERRMHRWVLLVNLA